MLIYNVTINIDASIQEEWENWMTNLHIPEIMKTNLVLEYCFCSLEKTDEQQEGLTFVVQYYFENKENYTTYVEKFAPQLRQDGINRFGNKFLAFRTIMEVKQRGNELSAD